VTLSLATVVSVVAVALLGIAFGTDNWNYYAVRRDEVQRSVQTDQSMKDKFDSDPVFFTRTRGLFRVCFPHERPDQDKVKLYLSPVETYCTNVDYFIPDSNSEFKTLKDLQQATIHMARSMVAMFVLAFTFIFIAFWTGVCGCWRRSPANITSTGVLMILACLFTAGSMGLWHGIEYYETQKIYDHPFQAGWPDYLKASTDVSYDWSYFLAWIGVGFSLIAALLFFGAARCLQDERDRDTPKMQYIMPVYPQKQPYGYGVGYPGPYYHGAQYGPYNY
jgi:hypothetical protein